MTEIPNAAPITTSGRLPVAGGQLYYETVGRGEPLVLLHAGIAHLRMWDEQIPALAEGFRAIRYDLRGFGRSTQAEAPFAHTADLLAVLDGLEMAQAHLLGCSKGAGVCLDFALAHPNRVRSLVLVGGAPGGFEGTGWVPPQWDDMRAAQQAHDLDRMAELETQIWLDGAGRQPADLPAALRERVRAMSRQALEHEEQNAAHEQPEAPEAYLRLSEIRAPALILVGDLDDPDLVAAADLMAAHIPAARHAVLRGSAHLPNLEQPAEFNRLVLDFLNSLAPAA